MSTLIFLAELWSVVESKTTKHQGRLAKLRGDALFKIGADVQVFQEKKAHLSVVAVGWVSPCVASSVLDV